MATVYLARDRKHDRQVAIKVLKPELGAVLGADRFLAEIKVTANLQHPNLLPLFDSGEAAGLLFYVMPFVEGETLRSRLDREMQLPVDEAVRIAAAIAGALAYAHEHGVIHRDLKPENILMQAGQPVIADFGIALAVSKAGGARVTQTGLSLGTPQYMSPEQAAGDRVIDGRSDLYSLAAMLYEMLTGDPPHTSSSVQGIIAKVLTDRPRPVREVRSTVPVHVELAMEVALAKLPADRFATASEFALALQGGGDASTLRRYRQSSAILDAVPALRRSRKRELAWVLVAILASAGLTWSLLRREPPKPVIRYALSFPASQAPVANGAFAVSPDGASFAYVGPGESPGTQQIWIKQRDREVATPLPGTTNATALTFSPDGQSIAFVLPPRPSGRVGPLLKLPLSGGAAITLADSALGEMTWLDDGTVVYSRIGPKGFVALRQVSDLGGTSSVVWESDTASAFNTTALPGRRGVVYAQGNRAGVSLWVAELPSLKAHRVVADAAFGVYLPIGDLVYVRSDGAAFVVPFSLRSLETTGPAVPLPSGSGNQFAVSSDGTLYARTGVGVLTAPLWELVWADRAGRLTSIDSSFSFRMIVNGANAGWALSPDGARVALGRNTEAGDQIWVKQLPRGAVSRISFDSGAAFRPRWTRDGRSLIYVSRSPVLADPVLRQKAADGTGAPDVVARVKSPGIFEGAVLADGKSWLIRTGGIVNAIGGRDIMLLQAGDTVPKPVVATKEFDEASIALSPDGRWLAYESNETGQTQIVLRPFPNVDGGKWVVSTAGGRAPLWSRNGRELFFVNAARQMVVMQISGGATPLVGAPTTLFTMGRELYLADQENYTPFDIAPDGRFLMARRVNAAAAPVEAAPIIVTLNWFEELREKLASSGKKK